MERSPQSSLNMKKVCDKSTVCQRILLYFAWRYFSILIKNKGITIFENTFLYIAYADDSTLFLKDKISIKELLNRINHFLSFTDLKPDLSKCEVAGISAMKEVNCILQEGLITPPPQKYLKVSESFDFA